MGDSASSKYGFLGRAPRNHIINGAMEIAQRITPAPPINGMYFVSASVGWIVGGLSTTSYIAVTNDGGETWTTQDSSAAAQILRSVFFFNSTNGWAVGDGGVIIATTNAGATWTAQTSGVATALRSVFFTSTTQGWAVGASGVIRTTTDGGANWTAQTSGVATQLNGVFFTSSTQGWTCGASGVIRTTSDGGANWTAQTSGVATGLNALFFTSSTQGWTVGASGVIRTTADGGANWTGQTSGTTAQLNSVYFNSSSQGWICGGFTVLTTSNGGSSWSLTININGESTTLNAIFSTSSTTAWIGSNSGLNKTTDTGSSYTQVVPSPLILTLPASGESFYADRFSVFKTSGWSGKYNIIDDAPDISLSGFKIKKSIRVTNGTGASGATSDLFAIRYKVEGYDYQELHGTEVRIQYYVKTSVAGTYSVGFENNGRDRSYIGTFTVGGGETNTWLEKYIDLTLDSSGTWLFNIGKGLVLYWVLDSGSDYESATVGSWKSDGRISSSSQINWAFNTGATFQITGVALYRGVFSHKLAFSRSSAIISDELRKCQRYCFTEFNNPFDGTLPRTNESPNNGNSNIMNLALLGSSTYQWVSKFPVPMRIAPAATLGSALTFPPSYHQSGTGTTYNNSAFSLIHSSKDSASISIAGVANGGFPLSTLRRNHDSTHYLFWRFDAEL